METDPINGLTEEQLADLARLADGTLPAERQAEVEARVAASPELAQMVARQGQALEALRTTAGIGAPARLRAEVERRRSPRRSRSRTALGSRVAILASSAAVALALIVVIPGTFEAGLTVADAATLGEKPPTQPAPGARPGTPQLLAAKVDDVPFPNYVAKFGWRAAGARSDKPSGRRATTVYYEKSSRSVAYTIVAGDALDRPSGAASTRRAGVEYRSFRHDGRTVVTWQRGGQTCVLSGKAVTRAELIALADWRGKGAIRF
jgi:hypothetical protein